MLWIERNLTAIVQHLAATRPAVLVTGPRQTGKSSLLKHLFPAAHYVSLDRPRDAEMAEQNPAAVLDIAPHGQVIIDEIQQAPALFHELKIRIDANRSQRGRWILTGSQLFPLMHGVAESLAGRVGLVHLASCGASELRTAGLLDATYLWRGGYPELWSTKDILTDRFFDDYIATYLERDLRPLLQVQDLRTFDRFLRAVALRAGQLVNYEALATDVGVSAVTCKKWLSTLQTSGIVTVLEPFFSNLTKRLIKTPKIFFNDHGLLCHLVGARVVTLWQNSPVQEALWENLVFGQIFRWAELHSWQSRLFFWRDKSSREVDFVVDMGHIIALIEAKSAEQPTLPVRGLEQVAGELQRPPVKVVKVLACRTQQPGQLAELTLWNPLRLDFQSVIDAVT